MEKKNNTKKELRKIEKEFVSFGNRKKVFWKITLATIIISVIGIPVMINNQDFLKRFLVIWILEIIYIAMYLKWDERKRK